MNVMLCWFSMIVWLWGLCVCWMCEDRITCALYKSKW